ncbi:MAG: 4a-hydroxytetrahydrobiopterin dehydratase [Granulosicoccus sp.]
MTIEKAADQQINEFLDKHSLWEVEENKLHREYVFSGFAQAFGFMTEIALIAERMDHHPEWKNVYKKVNVNLSTHEADGITERDFHLAEQMEKIAAAK